MNKLFVNDKNEIVVTPQSQVQLDRGSLPSEPLKGRSLETGQSRDVAEGAVLRASPRGSSLKCVASSFLQRDHPVPGIDLQP
ncbi:MAG: hypothetical protein A2157_16635 [Deltaproteobacteria bacterium RBG_16_47_11]|nr:MAG: hypothetical protein A2157_16635 [Deltaproteobacteria bacterium RBG_16_47_11]